MNAGAWARHYQEEWQRRAGDPQLPYWLRVAAAAYGHHGDNGHARFKRGQLALILATPDGKTGPRPYTNVGRAITDAVEYGWLADESFWGCLVVPAHAIKKGAHTSSPGCPIHLRKARSQAAESLTHRAIGDLKPTPGERFVPRIAHSLSDSTLNPLSSDLSLPRQGQPSQVEAS